MKAKAPNVQKLDIIKIAVHILKIQFCPEIYERSYQISEIEIAITFEQK